MLNCKNIKNFVRVFRNLVVMKYIWIVCIIYGLIGGVVFYFFVKYFF